MHGFRIAVLALFASTASVLAGQLEDGSIAYGKGDFPAAITIWLPIANAGDAVAQFNLGIMYDQGLGVSQDRSIAGDWYRKSAEQGDASAAFNLALMIEKGDGQDQNMAEALRWYHSAADGGDLLGQFKLGEIYAEGRGVTADAVKAIGWFEKAAAQNYAPAMSNLSSIYAMGKGVSPDLGKATEWSEKADVALMFDQGAGACTPRSTVWVENCRRKMPKL